MHAMSSSLPSNNYRNTRNALLTIIPISLEREYNNEICIELQIQMRRGFQLPDQLWDKRANTSALRSKYHGRLEAHG